MDKRATFRNRLRSGDLLVGTFVKTPSPHTVEILGAAGLDFAVIDQEHAPIDMAHLDMMTLAGHAMDLPLLVRRWGGTVDWVSPALDVGLTGVMVPHVMDTADAEAVCDAVRFVRGKRGLSPSPRAGRYGGLMLDAYRDQSDMQSVAAVQIEDEAALEHVPAICAINDVDMVFIGPADLSQSLKVPIGSDALNAAIERIVKDCITAGKSVGLFVTDATQIAVWRSRGVSLFVCGSDQSILRHGVTALVTASTT